MKRVGKARPRRAFEAERSVCKTQGAKILGASEELPVRLEEGKPVGRRKTPLCPPGVVGQVRGLEP